MGCQMLLKKRSTSFRTWTRKLTRTFTSPKLTLDEAFEKKDDISDACQSQLQESMAAYGFQIHKALVTELQPDSEVAQSMNEINKQKRLRDAALMAAEAEKIKIQAGGSRS